MVKELERLAQRRRFGVRPGLGLMRELMGRLGNPQDELAVIHVAGTNGKGAVSVMCEAVLRAAGYPVGCYLSPHLVQVNERFRINGEPVSDEVLEGALGKVMEAVQGVEQGGGGEATFFECLTAVAFVLFREAGVRLAVLETGLGGRLDATNIVVPLVSVITQIGLDHCSWLGETLAEVAGEKAGIIKPGRPVVCGALVEEALEVVGRVAQRNGSQMLLAGEQCGVEVGKRDLRGQRVVVSTANRTLPRFVLPLGGNFQGENLATAVTALEVVAGYGIELSDEAFVAGLGGVVWPGRFQVVAEDPAVVVDGAHNPQAARALVQGLKGCGVRGGVALVAGFCSDKDIGGVLRELQPVVECGWAVSSQSPRAVAPEQLAVEMRRAGIREVSEAATALEGVEAARRWARENGGVLVVCGSLFLAGEVLSELGALPWKAERRDENECVSAIVS